MRAGEIIALSSGHTSHPATTHAATEVVFEVPRRYMITARCDLTPQSVHISCSHLQLLDLGATGGAAAVAAANAALRDTLTDEK